MNSDLPHTIGTDEQVLLNSWKEIGAYLQRNSATARRWEKEEGLPVHRHSHKSRSSVYAYPTEIDAWRASRKVVPEAPPARSPWRVPAYALTTLLCLVMVGNGFRPRVASAQAVRGPAKHLLCADCADLDSRLSRDGRWMAFTDWATGDLAIRDLTTQKVKRLLVKPGTWGDSKDSGTYGEWPVLSPDLRQIVYLWAIDEREHRFQLRVMANEPGAKSRLVIDSPENIDYKPVSWFPDRASVLVAIQKPGRDWQLARVSVSDGAVTVLKSLEWRIDSWDRCDVSPDGQNIVYSALAVNPSKPVPAPHEPKDRHIYILAADGSSETEIVKTSGINQNPVWTPDGKRILFTSDRSGKFDLWSQAIQDGKAAGAASMVRADIGDISTMGIYGGSYYVFDRLPQGSEYIHIVEPASGGNARETDTFVGLAPKWSPDGKSIAFKRHHPGSGDSYDLVVHLIETGDERTYNPNLGTTGNGPPLWFHDRSLVTGFTVAGSAAAYQIRLEPKDFKELPLHIQLWSAAISPDDKTAYFVRRANDGKPAQVIAVNLGTGEERSIFVSQGNRPLSIALSPDGRTIALRQYGQIARMSVDGTGFREVYTMPANGAGNGRVAWSSDGSSILFDQRQPGGASHRALMRIQADGGGVPSLAFSARSMTGFDPSPDGSHFAFSSSDKTIDLWALDNVLAGFK